MEGKKETTVANHREGWGHCKDCGKWSYFLDSKKVCNVCREKKNG